MKPAENSDSKRASVVDQFNQIVDRLLPDLKQLWRERKRLLKINIVVIILLLVYLIFLAKPYFESTVTILPEYGNKSSPLSGLSDLAALAGVSIGEASPLEIYQNLISSEAVLGPAIYAKYKTTAFHDSVDLIQYLDIEPLRGESPEIQQRDVFLQTYKELTKFRLSTELDPLTKILDVKVVMPESQLSADVANNIVQSLDEYIRTKRKSYASNQRFYLEKRLDQIKDSLRAAEDALELFQVRNRVVEQSPQLQLELNRMTREVDILQTVYAELTRQLELVKIDEIKDTPVINVKELAHDPLLKKGPKRILLFLAGVVLSIVGSILYIHFEKEIRGFGITIAKGWRSVRES